MKRLHRYLPLLALLLMLAGSLTSCRDAGVRDALQRAETLMESDPHAARAVLDSLMPNVDCQTSDSQTADECLGKGSKAKVLSDSLQSVSLKYKKNSSANFQSSIFNFQSKRDAALYALLRTQADYKCNIRLTSDSLPLIATNYYGTRRKTQHAALAQYYLGCAYSDMHRDLDAIDALLRATTLFPDTTNKYFANCLFELGLLYSNHHMYDDAISVFSRYRPLPVCESDSTNIGYADYYLGRAYLFLGNYSSADSLFQRVIHNTHCSETNQKDTYFQLAKLYFYERKDIIKATEYINTYLNFFKEERGRGAAILLKAEILSESNNPALASTFYHKAIENSTDIYARCTAYKGLTQVSSLIGKTDSTSFFVNQYTTLLDSIYSINRQQEIAEIQNNPVIELHDQQLKARHTRFMLWMGIVLVAVVAGAVVFLLQADRRRKRHNLQLQEELRQANVALLQAQNEEQPADMDALYRNKLAACQNLFRSLPSARLLLTAPEKLTSEQRQALMDDLTRSFVDIMMDIKNASHAVNDQELLYCILTSLQSPTTYIAALLNTTDSTLRTRKSRLKEKMPESLFALFFS